MLTTEQALQTLASHHPDYQAFAESLPGELKRNIDPFPEGLAEEVLALVKKESPEISKFLDMQQENHEPRKFFPGAELILPLGAMLFLLRSHIKIDLPYFSLEHKPAKDKLLEKILDTLNKHVGKK